MSDIPVRTIMVRRCMLAILQREMRDVQIKQASEQLLSWADKLKPKAVILDLSTMPVFDSFMARALFDAGLSLKLMGSQMIIAGLPNAIIAVMVELGIEARNFKVTRDVDAALDLLGV